MSKSLSYQALKIVIEFLDPHKRIHITRRNSSLMRIDKAIPVRVENFHISEDDMFLDEEQAIDNPREVNTYLAGRQSFYAKSMLLGGPRLELVPPADFKIISKELNCHLRYFARYLPMMHERCFPLRRLRTRIEEPAQLDHPVLRSVDELEIEGGFDGMFPYIYENITVKTVIFAYGVPTADFLTFISNCKKYRKETRTTYKFLDSQILMWELEENLSNFKNEKYDGTSEFPFLIIPIERSDSSINVYSTKQDGKLETTIKIESSKQKRQRTEADCESVDCKKAKNC